MTAVRLLLLLMLPLLASCEAWRMESAGRAKRQRGLALIRGEAAEGIRANLPERERARKMAALREGVDLIRDGMRSYAAASEKTGKSYETPPYQEGLIVARKMLMALRD